MTKTELKEEFDRKLMIARQLNLFGDNPSDEERLAAENRLKEISSLLKTKKKNI